MGNNSINLDVKSQEADGASIGGGIIKRFFTWFGSNITIQGSGSEVHTFPSSGGTLINRTSTDTLTNKTLTTPKVGTSINDTNGNEVIKTPATASAVNEITVTNAATGNAPTIAATGDDSNIDLNLDAKGTGKLKFDAHYQTPQTYTPSAAATATLDLSIGNEHRITMPAGNITIALSNAVNGIKFIVDITQDGTGSRLVTWFSTIKWVGGVTPTLTTTANKRDSFGFKCTGTNTYDGYIIGQNI